MPSPDTENLLRTLSRRPGHDEVKAGFRELLVREFGVEISALEFERRVPEVRGRLDALIGRTIFEAKRNLDKEWADMARRMPDYLADRERAEGEKFVGLASDGLKWAVFELQQGALVKLRETTLDLEKIPEFLAFLDGALALKSSLPPDALTIRAELGRESIACHRVDTLLRALWVKLEPNPAVYLKRQLWGELLKLVYGREVEGDDLWFQHTFLVIVAKCIALAVMLLPEDDPKRLLSGEAFVAAGIHGAVESDFFDWVIADRDGDALVRRVMAHVRRFRLAEVESDVLKVLYESLIDRDERHGLGEYYTPDWLASKVVRHAVDRPLDQRVLDPACGSGTFLFHAIRLFLGEAEAGDLKKERWVLEACDHVAGMDIHPVAVIIARITYLLALSPALAFRKGAISIPVYLGDAMQLSISSIIDGTELTIKVPPARDSMATDDKAKASTRVQLDFPDIFCRDPALFDKVIERMRTGSEADMTRLQFEQSLHRITEQHYREDVKEKHQRGIDDLGKTYETMDRLRRDGRDTVWAYVARNLSRPLAFSSGSSWAHVLVGNPPWVAFRHMSADLQKRFKELANGENVFVARVSSQNDLCALFTVRAVDLYLRGGGKIAFVLPMAALTRGQFEKFRSGSFNSVRIAWEEAWTMGESVQPLFPVPSCVVFGQRKATSRPLPDRVKAFSGSLPMRDASLQTADAHLSVTDNAPALQTAQHKGGSPYRTVFRNGATLFPRMLVLVERKMLGRLGADSSIPFVGSRRNNQEKEPWKSLPGIENKVEVEFLHPIMLGESILPYRVFRSFEGVVPVISNGTILDSEAAMNRGFDGLFGWMRKAEAVWEGNKRSDKLKLVQLFDFFKQLSAQFPLPDVRVVYAASGTNPSASILRDNKAVIEHKLYWGKVASIAEARFLVAILNSETARKRSEGRQSRGQWGARDFDKVIFNLPIPRFDAKQKLHLALAKAAEQAETLAATVPLPDGIRFQAARGLVRKALTEAGLAQKIDALVGRLLDDAPAS